MRKLRLVGLILFIAAIGLFLHSIRETGVESKSPSDSTLEANLLSGSGNQRNPMPVGREESPFFMEESFLKASLGALEKNGSKLSLPMPSKHIVRCEARETAEALGVWALANGFETEEPTIFLGHGSVEFFDIVIRRTEVPEITRIQEQGREIAEGVRAFDGAVYHSWVGEIVGA